jgi:hypothetical protein
MVTNLESKNVNSTRSQNKGFLGGAILIMLGMITLFSQLGFVRIGEFILGSLGIIFIFAAFLRRRSGLLVPGGILVGVNAAALLVGFRPIAPFGSGAFLLVFSGGWLLISVLSVILNRFDSSTKVMLWPLFPAAFIAAIGGLLMYGETGLFLLSQLSLVWPVFLILLGLWIIFRRR